MQNIIFTESPVDYFRKASQILLNRESTNEELSRATRALHTVLGRVTGIEGAIKDPKEKFETSLPSGFALSPGYAADCTLDTIRVVKYIRALQEEIEEQKIMHPGKPVNVLYAGCGPFAPFALPFTWKYTPGDVRFTLLDIHERSIDAAKKITREFQIEEYFTDFIVCDATVYEPENNNYQILVTETMHRTLSREPHVMIVKNLAPRLAADGVVIPEKVIVSACLSDFQQETMYLQNKITADEISHIRLPLGNVFQITKNEQHELSDDKMFFKGPKIRIPGDTRDKDILVLLTHIRLNRNIEIGERESGITFPHFAFDLLNFNSGDILEFSFRIKDNPGIQYNVYSELRL